MSKYVIIVAGGSGSRFGSALPKQFLPLNGVPVLIRTISRFAEADSSIHVIVVLPNGQIGNWLELCGAQSFFLAHSIVAGGQSRWQSVKNALDSITVSEGDLIAVHDGVRPLVPVSVIAEAFRVAAKNGSAVPCVPVTDTIRQVTDGSSHILPRRSLMAVQTPQVFNAVDLKKAYDAPFNDDFTDDASVMEAAGHKIALTKGDVRNIKITHPDDLKIAEILLKNE
ncbi:MAG: 2-C-methyl-D-erythritol 4-phosphate cytidylyltransferase [Muribaculaceae bacterium]|jgi:2-C-methyl-D-erythritol 4-phosphate cytidylyltransferase|nr:2-C-methyl-D-erythritol 4-phosphate cytidylyltransferase [Muribaculaceae bacterium]